MKRTIKIEINCGDTTCFSAPGEFCKYLGGIKFGSSPVCLLFRDLNPAIRNVGGHKHLKDVGGWVRRCPECLDRVGESGIRGH